MGCLKGKKTPKPRPGLYACKKCMATAKKKKRVCKPKLLTK